MSPKEISSDDGSERIGKTKSIRKFIEKRRQELAPGNLSLPEIGQMYLDWWNKKHKEEDVEDVVLNNGELFDLGMKISTELRKGETNVLPELQPKKMSLNEAYGGHKHFRLD
jgi:hypothetical protein